MNKKIIISACLLGVSCRYDGRSKPCQKAIDLYKKRDVILVCPEQMGGLSTPRTPSETTGDGLEILKGKEKVITKTGDDVTQNFIKGAEEVLKIIKLFNIKEAVLKQKSPSCGCGKIYDGTFSDKLIKGDGVTAALLKKNGIKVITEEDL
ncbi:DUF523 domain-containing protein [Patescibacteria group bacterium]|nr:DUF523 domain-containing protein [Patescibacteria group bacterium]MBU4274842.1 DUF523 domain-containing protein [Patescibacteria group bacterium]MBU4367989.1 DUF523 domain-containing protein [Patescibacteria group bacterium]MBU4462170.1 DUF523 domain-containing protein [Patescibacteria group bacterium]MCG2699833.1 DUF523 domain-containing protein [Candidatus Parcubacteria bacterium]